jgi:hypothetical protein
VKFNRGDAKRSLGAGLARGQGEERDLELSLEMAPTVGNRIGPMAVTSTSDLRIPEANGKGYKL